MTALRLTFGIDPGLGGAIATLIDGEPGPIIDMPVTDYRGHGEVDAFRLAGFIKDLRGQHPGAYVSACVERVRAMPPKSVGGVERRAGSQSSMNFGDNYGKAKAVLEVLGIDYTRAEPASWKRRFMLTGKEKDASRLLALARFPSVARELQRKKDCGRADALWIALFHEQTDTRGSAAA